MDLNLKNVTDSLAKKEMNRKEFLASVGAAALTLVGVSSVLKAFNVRGNRANGYGSSPYGGGDERR